MKYLLMGTSSNFGNVFSMAAASVAPALTADACPTQILLNNFLYDVAQNRRWPPTTWTTTINRRAEALEHAGEATSCCSSARSARTFDFLTFFVLLCGVPRTFIVSLGLVRGIPRHPDARPVRHLEWGAPFRGAPSSRLILHQHSQRSASDTRRAVDAAGGRVRIRPLAVDLPALSDDSMRVRASESRDRQAKTGRKKTAMGV